MSKVTYTLNAYHTFFTPDKWRGETGQLNTDLGYNGWVHYKIRTEGEPTQMDRDSFMEFFRDDELLNTLSADDRVEVFRRVLPGNSDLTVELLRSVLTDYNGGNDDEDIVVINYKDIGDLDLVFEHISDPRNNHIDPETRSVDGIKRDMMKLIDQAHRLGSFEPVPEESTLV